MTLFLSTLSLRRATFNGAQGHISGDISIHALLAESDLANCTKIYAVGDFYPRSPCGERPYRVQLGNMVSEFLSTLSLRRATQNLGVCVVKLIFLSTLSLRRATGSGCSALYWSRISIHALLAESDGQYAIVHGAAGQFLSTLSLRRATPGKMCRCSPK